MTREPWRSASRWASAGILLCALGSCTKKGRCEKVDVEISGDHLHSASVSADKVKHGVGGTYRVHGEGHDHAVRLSDDDMQKLARGEPVTARTSSVNAHVHEVTLRCGE